MASQDQEQVSVAMQFYEDAACSLGVCLGLSRALWLEKPMEKLVRKFFRGAYAVAFPDQPKVDVRSYGVVDAATGEDVTEKLVGDAHFSDDDRACLFVVRREQNRRSPKLATKKKLFVQQQQQQESLDYDALCLHLFEQRHRNVPFCQYAHARRAVFAARDRRLRRSAAEQRNNKDPPTRHDDDDSDDEELSESSLSEVSPRPVQRSEPKDWAAINYKKALCPHVVAGRKCPRGADCTYAHSYDELPSSPRRSTTADLDLGPPEWWQLGVFAEPSRRGSFLWKKMTRKDQRRNRASALRQLASSSSSV